MKLVTLRRDMRPWQAGHDAAVPDAVAEKLIAEGDATLSAAHAASGLQPDAQQRPPNRYLTRKAPAAAAKDSAA